MSKIEPDRVQLNAFRQDAANIDFCSLEPYSIQLQ